MLQHKFEASFAGCSGGHMSRQLIRLLLLPHPHVAARSKIKTESELKMNYAEMNAKLLSQSEIYKYTLARTHTR